MPGAQLQCQKGGVRLKTSLATMHQAHVEYLANFKNPKQVF